MRFLLVTFCVFLLAACSSPRTAEDAYKEGKYLESIELITQYVEEKGEAKLDADDLDRFRLVVSNVMAHYENKLLSADRTDYASRITSYESLLKMKSRLSNRFYSQQVYFFNNKYDVKQLRQLIAEEYYLYGNSINANDRQSYYFKAEMYRKGMEQYKYKDIESLYTQTNTKYMQVAAKEYYETAQRLVQAEEYKDAADYFSKAANVYKPLGIYKDSDKLFVVYDKKYRMLEAESFYQKAKDIQTHANTRYEYRQMAKLYSNAASIYSPYGDYKGSGKLSTQYQQKGIVKIYSPPGLYHKVIQQNINKDYIQYVNNQSVADIVIDITENSQYKDTSSLPVIRAMSENILDKTIEVTHSDGVVEKKDIYKTYYYNVQTDVFVNVLDLTTNINVSGIYAYRKSDDVKKSSSMTKYSYTGNVPSKYSNYSSGSYLSQRKLLERAKVEQDKFLNSELSNLATIFERL